jgi:hypothetical protein
MSQEELNDSFEEKGCKPQDKEVIAITADIARAIVKVQ